MSDGLGIAASYAGTKEVKTRIVPYKGVICRHAAEKYACKRRGLLLVWLHIGV